VMDGSNLFVISESLSNHALKRVQLTLFLH
jgi:hypothetical protein